MTLSQVLKSPLLHIRRSESKNKSKNSLRNMKTIKRVRSRTWKIFKIIFRNPKLQIYKEIRYPLSLWTTLTLLIYAMNKTT